MHSIQTKQFGTITFDENSIFDFPNGLPGFESETRFLCVERPALRPLVFLQSVENSDLCFITIPARSVDPAYQLEVPSEELKILGISGRDDADVAAGLACLAIVCLPTEGDATANLLGPVVLSRETRRGVQAVREDRRYSAMTPLRPSVSTGKETAPHSERRLMEV